MNITTEMSDVKERKRDIKNGHKSKQYRTSTFQKNNHKIGL